MNTEIILEQGDILYREGDANDTAYIIDTGEIVLYSNAMGRRIAFERRGAGSIVGELSVLTGHPRTVTVEALTPCRLFVVSAEEILARFESLDPILRACIDTSIGFTATLTRRMNEGGSDIPLVESTLRDAEAVTERFKLERDIVLGLERDEFHLVYQPIVDLSDGGVVGVEALMRWEHTVLVTVPPVRFIEVAEEMGSIGRLTELAVSDACAALGRMRACRSAGEGFYVSVNISGKDIERDDFAAFVARTIALHGVDPRHLKLEVTETSLVADPLSAARRLDELRALGCGISIDDFGTGYSNLAYLKSLPLTTLKIDRAFAGDACRNGVSRSIVTMLLGLGRNMGVDIVAEGLETEEDVAMLRKLGCRFAQGYHFCRPLAESDLLAFVEDLSRRAEAA